MNAILEQRLSQIDLTIELLIQSIPNISHNDIVLLYTSHLEGLGTLMSDMDVYVFSSFIPYMKYDRSENNVYFKAIYLPNCRLDIEYRTLSDVESTLKKVLHKETSMDIEELKFVSRFFSGEGIFNSNQLELLRKTEVLNCLKLRAIDYYYVWSSSELDDAVTLLNAGEYECALHCAQQSLYNAMGAVNACEGRINFKRKWIPKIFVSNKESYLHLYQKYEKLYLYCNVDLENQKRYIESLIEFSQDILSHVTIER